jgi:hypothetical protein
MAVFNFVINLEGQCVLHLGGAGDEYNSIQENF